jgi:peptide/nickel transport system permease protein
MNTETFTKPSQIRRENLKAQLKAAAYQINLDWQEFLRHPLGVLGLIMAILFCLMPLIYWVLMTFFWNPSVYDPAIGFDMQTINPSLPSWRHLLGTDGSGHDVFSMLLQNSKQSIIVGMMAGLVASVIGTILGALASYYRNRWLDFLISNLADALLLIPAPLFMVMISLVFLGMSPWQFGIIYGVLVGCSTVALVMRSMGLTMIVKPFIQAAKVSGGNGFHIIIRHLIPQMIPMSVLYFMVTVTGAVVADGFASFFGSTRTYSGNWGTMIYNAMMNGFTFGGDPLWHVILPPALSLSLFAASFYFISMGLQRIATPSLREI